MKRFSIAIALLLSFVFLFSACKNPKEGTTTLSPGETVTESSDKGKQSDDKETAEDESGKGNESDSENSESTDDGEKAEMSEVKTSVRYAGESEVETTKISTEKLKDAFLLSKGVYVLELFPYSGRFVEDGSNEEVSKIAAVKVFNTSDKPYQLLDFSLETKNGELSFRATTLLPGTVMTVLNLGKEKYKGSDIDGGKITLEAPFSETPGIKSDKLQISFTDGFINAKNISDDELENVYIYYKSIDENGFFGGITYRVGIDRIKAGEIVQTGSKNISSNSSRIVFVTVQ